VAKFEFRLATLLRLRERVRDERQNALAEALRADDQLAAQLDAVRAEAAAALIELQQSSRPGSLDISRLQDGQRYEAGLASAEQSLVEERVVLAREIENRRQALASAETEFRTLEKLRETQQTRHADGQRRADAKQLDDATMRQAAVKRG
jgi:flagellar export protein FliJ